MYQSNNLYHRLFKYSFLLVSFLVFIIGLLGLLKPQLVSFNNSDISENQALSMIAISAFPLVLFLLIQRKFVAITVDDNGLKIKNSDLVYEWNQIGISQIPFIFPPLYKLKTHDKKGFKLFNTDNKYLWLSIGVVKDLSAMGKLIKKKEDQFDPLL